MRAATAVRARACSAQSGGDGRAPVVAPWRGVASLSSIPQATAPIHVAGIAESNG